MIDLFRDTRALLPNLQIEVIFDVGANIRQSSLEYREAFPEADIYTFEPSER